MDECAYCIVALICSECAQVWKHVPALIELSDVIRLLMSEPDHAEVVPCWLNQRNEREVFGHVRLGRGRRHFRLKIRVECGVIR